MTNSLKALAAAALTKPKVCNYGAWANQKRLKLPSSTAFRISDEQKSAFPNQLAPLKKPQLGSGKQMEFDVNCHYYNLLEVSSDASVQAIRSSYFRMAKKFHPDAFYVTRTTDTDQQFAKLTEAYEVLSDPTKRSEYDRFLYKNDKPKTTVDVSTKMSNLLSDQILSEVSKTVKMVKKAVNNVDINKPKVVVSAPAVEPNDTEFEVLVPFMHAITGQIHHANLRFSSFCPSCKRSSRCGCNVCHGTGYIPIEKVIPIRIPSAVDDGQILLLKNPIDGRDNIKIRVKIENHPHFVRDKLDILTTTKIPWLVGLLGGEITVKNVYGDIVPVSIRPGTDSHTIIRLEGKGVKTSNATAGDHLVIVKIIMPAKLSNQQKKMLLQFF